LLWEQLKAMGLTLAMAVIGTIIIAFIVKALVGLKASPEVQSQGLDLAEHGEEGYHGES
jgi:Amt family ammonium transporter